MRGILLIGKTNRLLSFCVCHLAAYIPSSLQLNSILYKLTQIQCFREGYNYYSSVTNINVKNTVQ